MGRAALGAWNRRAPPEKKAGARSGGCWGRARTHPDRALELDHFASALLLVAALASALLVLVSVEDRPCELTGPRKSGAVSVAAGTSGSRPRRSDHRDHEQAAECGANAGSARPRCLAPVAHSSANRIPTVHDSQAESNHGTAHVRAGFDRVLQGLVTASAQRTGQQTRLHHSSWHAPCAGSSFASTATWS